jgi:hypothetical protein
LEEDPELFPYQGGKARFASSLRALFLSSGAWGHPNQIWVSDVGPWAELFKALHDEDLRQQIEPVVRALVAEATPNGPLGPKAPDLVWDRVSKGDLPTDHVELFAKLLFLQRFSFRGKAVGIRNGRWASYGLNRSSAYGAPASDSFGAIGPQGPTLLAKLSRLRNFIAHAKTGGAWLPEELSWEGWLGRTIVLLDPPYAGTLGYPSGDMTRSEAVALALAWASQPNTVVFFCESEPVEELACLGWRTRLLTEDRGSKLSAETNRAEYVTISVYR